MRDQRAAPLRKGNFAPETKRPTASPIRWLFLDEA
jgi:hypothetical protein